MRYVPPEKSKLPEKRIKGDEDKVERSRPLYPGRIGQEVEIVGQSEHVPAPIIIRFPDGFIGIADKHDLEEV